MTPEDFRLACLQLAQTGMLQHGSYPKTGDIIARAKAYADFVLHRPARTDTGKDQA